MWASVEPEITFTAAVAMVASYLNWAFSLVFTAILAREIARRVPGVDYRAIGAMAFLGLGTVWAQGLSGSAALQVASATSSPPAVQKVIAAGGGRHRAHRGDQEEGSSEDHDRESPKIGGSGCRFAERKADCLTPCDSRKPARGHLP